MLLGQPTVLPTQTLVVPATKGVFVQAGQPIGPPSLGFHLNNTDILSNEISEWLHDPFLSDVVPTWISPLPFASLFYGCQSLLETGDPAADSAFNINGYQLQDEAFFSWFAKQPTSIGINGQYSYLGGSLNHRRCASAPKGRGPSRSRCGPPSNPSISSSRHLMASGI